MEFFEKIEPSGISSLAENTFQGYIWYSDKEFPKILVNEAITEAHFTDLPFIIEGFLYDEKKKISLHIKNFDALYHIVKFDVGELTENNKHLKIEDFTVPSHRIAGYKKLKFKKVYTLKEDTINPDFHFWEEELNIFTGFKK